jgi:hypothetical protein
MILESKTSNYVPHPEGVHPAVCLDVIDLGMQTLSFQGESRVVPRIRLVFESEATTPDGKRCSISRSFTASLHQKSKLSEFISKWRGRAVQPGEKIDLDRMIGACCTLVVGHRSAADGSPYACIDAISKPTRKVTPSGTYDPKAARERIKEQEAKKDYGTTGRRDYTKGMDNGTGSAAVPAAAGGVAATGAPHTAAARAASGLAGGTPALPAPSYDPEVGF